MHVVVFFYSHGGIIRWPAGMAFCWKIDAEILNWREDKGHHRMNLSIDDNYGFVKVEEGESGKKFSIYHSLISSLCSHDDHWIFAWRLSAIQNKVVSVAKHYSSYYFWCMYMYSPRVEPAWCVLIEARSAIACSCVASLSMLASNIQWSKPTSCQFGGWLNTDFDTRVTESFFLLTSPIKILAAVYTKEYTRQSVSSSKISMIIEWNVCLLLNSR